MASVRSARRDRRGRHRRPAGQRAGRRRTGSSSPTRSLAPGATPSTRVVLLRAEGRGFCAGVDIKELAADPTHDALIGVNRGCAAAFAAVYDCEVPVVAAVHGFCLGGGIGLVGNADVIVASEDATFGLPEVDRGALGAATHLARLVPQHRMRAMVYTGRARDRRGAARATARSRGSCRATSCWSAAREVAGRDRRQEPDDHPPREGVAQRHRPGRRQAQLPLRAGLHVRADPGQRRRRGPPGLRREARRGVRRLMA